MKKLMWMVLVIAPLIGGHQIWVHWRSESGENLVPAIPAEYIIGQKLPEDDLFEYLSDLGGPVMATPKGKVASWTDEDITSYLAENLPLFEQVDTSRLGPLNDPARPSRIPWSFDTSQPMPLAQSIHRLFCVPLVAASYNGPGEQTANLLRDAIGIKELFQENPSMLSYAIGSAFEANLIGVIISQEPDMAWQDPVNDLLNHDLKRSFTSAMWFEVQLQYYQWDHFENTADSPMNFVAQHGIGAFNPNDSKRLTHEQFSHLIGALDEPLDAYTPLQMELPSTAIGFNAVGRKLVAITSELYVSLLNGYGTAKGLRDATMIWLTLSQSYQEWNQSNVTSIIEDKKLTNPFTGQLYETDDEGRLLILENHDERWKTGKAVFFPVNRIVPPES